MKQVLHIFVIFNLFGCSAVSVSNGRQENAKVIPPKVELWSEKVSSRLSATKRTRKVIIKKQQDPAPRPEHLQKVVKESTQVKPVKRDASNASALQLSYKKSHFKHWLNYFSKKSRDRFIRHMKNAKQYEPLVRKIFANYGLPEDLFYVGLIESGYNTRIKSRASAVGPWQFMRGTGKMYGLRIDRSIDERYSIFKATDAAAQYFRDLYNIFGSWELALCAYNKGEYGIIRAIRKGNTRNYKELVKKKLIPRETMYYIPKLAAARAIYESPKRFRFPVVKPSERWDLAEYASVKVNGRIQLKTVAKQLKLSYSTLRKLNPDFRWRSVRSYQGLDVFFPRGHMKYQSRVKGQRLAPRSRVAHKRTRPYRYHRVRRGEYLGRIARKYKTTISRIKALNRLKRNKIYVGQKLKVPLGHSRTAYVVKRGDSLYKIAKRFKVSLNKLVRHNKLKSRVIFPKQKLFIPI